MGEVVHDLTPSWHAAQRGERARQSSWPRRRGDDIFASSSSDRARWLGVLQARGHRPGGHIAVVDGEQPSVSGGVVGGPALRAPLHRRSTGTCVPTRSSTCSTTAEPPHWSRRQRCATSLATLDLSRIDTKVCVDRRPRRVRTLRRRLVVASPLTCWSTNRKVARCSTRPAPLGDPKGVQKDLPHTPFGDPASAPVQIAQGIGMTRWRARRRVPLPRAALPRRPARLLACRCIASARRWS